MKNLQDFLRTLPDLIGDQTELCAIFTTYQKVAHYKSGPVDTDGRSGLNIIVNNGNYNYSMTAFVALLMGKMFGDHNLASISENVLRKDALEALNRATKNNEELVQLINKNLLVVVYAGVSAFSESFDYACRIHEFNPRAKIIVLTCDCDEYNKVRVLNCAIEDGKITDAVVTLECGGRDSMKRILEGLIASWPK